jgi:predicted Zn-dependent protease
VIKIARVSKEDPHFKSLPSSEKIIDVPYIYVKQTAEMTPEESTEAVKTVIQTALDYDKAVKWSAGGLDTTVVHGAIANSLGIATETKFTQAYIEVITRAGESSNEGSGYTVERSRNVTDFDYVTIAKNAAIDSVSTINPKREPLGEYEVIFKPEALTNFFNHMGNLGFSAKPYVDGRGFMQGKLGSQIFDEKFTLLDNARDPSTLNASSFDGEGVPKKSLMLVNCGVAENLCYDSYNSNLMNVPNTGHSVSCFYRGFFMEGTPIPLNVIAKPGDSSIEEMIRETKRGFLVTRLWYVNPVKEDTAVVSGMTCDGIWYIEGGEIKHPSQQMRFTDSILNMFKRIDLIGSPLTVESMPNYTLPAIKIPHFQFTGHTNF